MNGEQFKDDCRVINRDVPGWFVVRAVPEGAQIEWCPGVRFVRRLNIDTNWRRCFVAALNMDRKYPGSSMAERRQRLTHFFDLLGHVEIIIDEIGPLSLLERECISSHILGERCA